MAKNYWNTEYFSEPTAEQLQEKARATAESARKKGKELHPVTISGRKIAKSWWGNAWCENLEKYADYESRLERGKRYVRTGAVVDIQIQKGKVVARVQGRRKTPYKVEVKISPLSEERCQYAIAQCGEKIENIELLMKGEFPEEMKQVFLGEMGLFPASREISFNCSCPDWALMCKHVAAVLYGIGARFDEDPLLFFELRGIDVGKFIDITLENRIDQMLANADRPSPRIVESGEWEALFGL